MSAVGYVGAAAGAALGLNLIIGREVLRLRDRVLRLEERLRRRRQE